MNVRPPPPRGLASQAPAARHRQLGAIALPLTCVLAMSMALAALYAQRGLVLEVRSAHNAQQAAQAQEAAEAGVAWTLALLNRNTPLGDDCTPSPLPTGVRWSTHVDTHTLWAHCYATASVATTHHPTDTAAPTDGPAWTCRCREGALDPSLDDPDTPPSEALSGPGFTVQLHRLAGTAGSMAPAAPTTTTATAAGAPTNANANANANAAPHWQLQVEGHTSLHGFSARRRLTLGRLPALDTLPSAALTVRGDVQLGAGTSLHHTATDSGGLTLLASGAVDAPTARFVSTPGTPGSASVIAHDPVLGQLQSDMLHASVFRLSATTWPRLPTVATVTCAMACDATLREALGHHRLLHLPGGLHLDQPLTVGAPDQPVVLLLDGPLDVAADVVVHGLVYLRHAHWHGPVTVHGAVIAEQSLQVQGSSHLHHDLGVLQQLHTQLGSYAPRLVSWRDL